MVQLQAARLDVKEKALIKKARVALQQRIEKAVKERQDQEEREQIEEQEAQERQGTNIYCYFFNSKYFLV